jgi:hypothetical protein
MVASGLVLISVQCILYHVIVIYLFRSLMILHTIVLLIYAINFLFL